MWHLLTLGAMISCGFLAAWQWHRAGSAMGSALNVGYGLQWPAFALFFGYMWWRMLRMEAANLAGGRADADESDVPQPASGSTAAFVTEDDLLSRPTDPAVAPAADAAMDAARAPAVEHRGAGGPSPFGPRPAASRFAAPVTDEDDPELAEYNRMLAQLAARHPD
jgi:DNA-binding transcriptional regulator of glucitol operon